MGMLVIVAIAIVIVLAVWYSMADHGNKGGTIAHQRITPQEYQAGYAQRDHLLVDVRTAEEFGTGHIHGAVNIALPQLPQQMATLPKDQPVVLYCRSGARQQFRGPTVGPSWL